MRSDYALYVVAIIFFILTGTAALMLVEPERPLWVVTTAVLGLLFVGVGYSQRPKPRATAIKAPPLPPTPVPEIVIETPKEEKTEVIVEAAPTVLELTEVKGIGLKRAEQLKALGISNVNRLAEASAKDLAEKLKISPKITVKWIEDAKKLVEES